MLFVEYMQNTVLSCHPMCHLFLIAVFWDWHHFHFIRRRVRHHHACITTSRWSFWKFQSYNVALELGCSLLWFYVLCYCWSVHHPWTQVSKLAFLYTFTVVKDPSIVKEITRKTAVRDRKWKQSVTELTVCSSGMKVKRLESVVKQYFTVKDASVQSNELTRAWVFVIGGNYF